jgi:hypothetical protein
MKVEHDMRDSGAAAFFLDDAPDAPPSKTKMRVVFIILSGMWLLVSQA